MRKQYLVVGFLVLVAFSSVAGAQAKAMARGEFKPPAAEELAMKEYPAAPGAHAIILEWNIDQDDVEARRIEYLRIKVFTDEGKKYGDVEIPYFSNRFNITDIKARTIQPDGTVVPFNGKVFDKVLARTSSYNMRAKTFTFPDVRPGSILEYHYRLTWENNLLYPTHWDLQRNLFVRKATLSIKPHLKSIYSATYITLGVPADKQPVSNRDGFLLNLANVDAFEEEPFSLPESQIIPNINIYYTTKGATTPTQYWDDYAKETTKAAESFIGDRSAIKQAVASLLSPTDTPEQKLRKIYARVQKIRNLTYESAKTRQEQERITPKENKSVEDVLRNGYGYRTQINRLFIAMVRSAGLPADVVRVSQRDAQIFQQLMLDGSQLDSEITVATSGDIEVLLDPATPFCPYGLLSWENTGVTALRLTKGGGVFIQTPMPNPEDAVMQRKAQLHLDEDGNLVGKIMVELAGHYALRRRLNMLESDEVEQKKDFEKQMENWLPTDSKVKLANVLAREDGEKPLGLEFEVEIPSLASTAGARTLVPMQIFQTRNSGAFGKPRRTYPIYFRHPYQDIDTIELAVPAGMRIESVPTAADINDSYAVYSARWHREQTSVSSKRTETMNGFLFPADNYYGLKNFFGQVAAADKSVVVLRKEQK